MALRGDGQTPSFETLAERGFEGDPTDLIVVTFARPDQAPGWFRPEG